jgi:hypothetical protein
MEATETNGVWGQAVEISLPNGASSTVAYLSGVSCPSLGSCMATGGYGTNSSQPAMVVEETDGSWASATAVQLPSNSNSGFAHGYGVSCTGTTANCTLVGYYTTSSAGEPMADTESNGSWAQAVEVPFPSGTGATSGNLQGISCPSQGNCEAVGNYYVSTQQMQMATTESNGTWGQSTAISLPSGAVIGSSHSELSSISCLSIGNCVAVGLYPPGQGFIAGLLVNETAGSWAQGTEITPPSNAATGSSTFVGAEGVACSSDGACELGGLYETNSSAQEAFVDSGTMAPSGPTDVGGSSGNGSVDVSWAPVENATAYSVYAATAPGGENYSGPAACTATAPNDECTVTGLTNGTNYYFTVVATNAGGSSTTSSEISVEPRATPYGYCAVGSDGGTFSFGDSTFYGSEAGHHLDAPIVGIASEPNGDGYWEVGADGGVFSLGNATYYGGEAGKQLGAPIVGIAATPNGEGYWEVGANGAIYAFGQARYYGSESGRLLGGRIVGMAVTATGDGYWEVASDGAVYSFGDAVYYGGEAGKHLNAPIVGMAALPDGDGYWLVGSDGGVFALGEARYYGSEAGKRLAKPMVGITSTVTGAGYWEVAADGGVFSFGDAPFEGSEGAESVRAPVVGIASSPSGIV